MSKFIQGANLGNWLVLEKWMSPQTFANSDADDEFYLPRTIERSDYEARIRQHRAEYISERDFVLLRGMGINSVRIPVPYFIFGDREPFVGCIQELDNAFAWGKHYGISILIDLHTAPMGQNGFDNGGIQGVCQWSKHADEVKFVLTVLERLAQRYGHHDALYGIEILNEPITQGMWDRLNLPVRYPARDPELGAGSAPNTLEFLRDFYLRAYACIKPHLADGKKIVFHDGFELLAWQDFMTCEQYPDVVLDTHQYLMVAEAGGVAQQLNSYLDYLEHQLKPQYQEACAKHDVICGEWCLFNSLACGYDTHGGQSILNGISAADQGLKVMSLEERTAIYQALSKAQMSIWRLGIGHYYWNYKILFDTVTSTNWVGWDSWDLGRAYAFNWFRTDF